MADRIWIVRSPEGRRIGASVTAAGAVRDVKSHCGATTGFAMTELAEVVYDNRHSEHYEHNGYTLTREPLALPAVAAAGEAVAWAVQGADGSFRDTLMPWHTRRVEREVGHWDALSPDKAPHTLVPLYAQPSAAAGDAAVLEAADALYEWYTSHGGNAPIGSYLQRLYRAAEKRRAALTRPTSEGREDA